MFRSGNIEHPEDRFYNASIEVMPVLLDSEAADWNVTSTGHVMVGSFDQLGVAEGAVHERIGRVKELRIRVLGETDNWVVLSEVGG